MPDLSSKLTNTAQADFTTFLPHLHYSQNEAHAHKMFCQFPVVGLIDAVENQVDEIETTEECWWEVDVLRHRQVRIVSATDWIGGGQDTGSGVQRRDDSRFGDGDGLLLHDFVQDRAGRIIHLVEFVDAADTAVGEDEGARFED